MVHKGGSWFESGRRFPSQQGFPPRWNRFMVPDPLPTSSNSSILLPAPAGFDYMDDDIRIELMQDQGLDAPRPTRPSRNSK